MNSGAQCRASDSLGVSAHTCRCRLLSGTLAHAPAGTVPSSFEPAATSLALARKFLCTKWIKQVLKFISLVIFCTTPIRSVILRGQIVVPSYIYIFYPLTWMEDSDGHTARTWLPRAGVDIGVSCLSSSSLLVQCWVVDAWDKRAWRGTMLILFRSTL